MSSPETRATIRRGRMSRRFSKAANSFFLGGTQRKSTYWSTEEREETVEVIDDDEPYWLRKKKLGDEVVESELEVSNENNETPELELQVLDLSLEEDENPGLKKSISTLGDFNRSKSLRSVEMEPPSLKGRGRGKARDKEGYGINVMNDEKRPKPEVRLRSVPYFIITVSIINLMLMIWSVVLSGGFAPPSQNPMLGPDLQTLVEMGGKWVPSILYHGEWWRLFTATYLHGGFIHLLLNLLVQVKVGSDLEREHGTYRIFPIYILSGLSGNLLSALFLPSQVTVGASGAIYGFLGVLIVDLIKNWKKLRSPCKTYIFLCIGNVISLAIGLLPGIDNFAHIGGFVMGIISGVVFLPSMNFGSWSLKTRLIQVCIALPLMVGVFVGMFIPLYHGLDGSEVCGWCKYFNCLPVFDSCR